MSIEPTEIQPILDALSDTGPVAATVRQVVQDLPREISANVFRVLGQLCTATFDVPIAYLQGFSAEKRATTEARVALQKSVACSISAQVDVPQAYVQAAQQKYAERALGKQINVDRTVAISLGLLKERSKTEPQAPQPDISLEWLNHFGSEVEKMSSDYMQLLFAKVLAGEITKPGAFSIKSLRVLSEMRPATAEKFVALCSLTAIVEVAPQEHVAAAPWCVINALPESRRNKINSMLSELEADGLIFLLEHQINLSRHLYSATFAEAAASPLRINGKNFRLHDAGFTECLPHEAFLTGCLLLTQTGRELLQIVDQQVDQEYLETFRQTMKKAELDLEEI